MNYISWLLALLTALSFALMALKAGRSLVSWALTGGIIGLVVGTIVIGLGHATDNPFSDQQMKAFHVRWACEAALTIAVVSWFVTLSLHRQHLWLWRKLNGKPSRSPAVSSAEAKPRVEAPKQPSKA